jgi:hypothetical protein
MRGAQGRHKPHADSPRIRGRPQYGRNIFYPPDVPLVVPNFPSLLRKVASHPVAVPLYRRLIRRDEIHVPGEEEPDCQRNTLQRQARVMSGGNTIRWPCSCNMWNMYLGEERVAHHSEDEGHYDV